MGFEAQVLPDTGATHTLVSHDLILKHGLIITAKHRFTLTHAGSESLRIVGTVPLRIELDEWPTECLAIVVQNLSHEVLLGKWQCIELGIIPSSFPFRMPVCKHCNLRYDPANNAQCPCSMKNEANSVTSVKNVKVINLKKNETAESLKDKLCKMFKSTISDELSAKPMNAPPMKIYLHKDNYRPVRTTTARSVPKRFEAPAKRAVQDLIKKGVITTVSSPTEWCSPAFFVPKSDGKSVRMVTDFTKLNLHVDRPVHPFPSSAEIVQAVPPEAKIFAKMDAVHGYFQLALEDKSSYLTTFLLPSGRYRYLRAPMGLSASSDEWCRHSDWVVEGLSFAKKIVDDILVWAPTLQILSDRLCTILARCKSMNITISKSKLQISNDLIFAGFRVADFGISPDPVRTKAIQDFPTPQNIHDLRSYLGLANTLSNFLPDLVQATAAMRKLTCAGNAYTWLDEHDKEFLESKRILTGTNIVKPFHPNWPTQLLTDASRLYGLGFALMQHDPNNLENKHLVMCGSKSVTDTQTRYATIELECLAIMVAVRRCDFYLRGLPLFEVITDHKPLIGIFSKEIYNLDNSRLIRIREKLIPYNFFVTWVPGKKHAIADALSRAPVFPAEDEPELYAETAITCLAEVDDAIPTTLERMIAHSDDSYTTTASALLNSDDTPPNVPEGTALKKIWHRLSISNEIPNMIMLDHDRIVIPRNAIKFIVERLHAGHPGITKARENARQLYYWPGMNNDIAQAIENCEPCQEIRPKQQDLPARENLPSQHDDFPMQSVGTDLFSLDGDDYIVLVDRCSGYLCADKLRRTDTTEIITQLSHWFQLLGWPMYIRSDGGPEFRREFDIFCAENDIIHELSSPYNPQSNGLAEAAVKNAKQLLIKCKQDKQDFQAALADWINIPREDKSSPAQLMFGRRLKSKLPCLSAHLTVVNRKLALERKDVITERSRDYFNNKTKPLSYFEKGDKVRVKNTASGYWNQFATVVSRRSDQMSYVIDIAGKQYIRGRRLLKSANLDPPTCDGLPEQRRLDANTPDQSDDSDAENEAITAPPNPQLLQRSPRRSSRTRKAPIRFSPS